MGQTISYILQCMHITDEPLGIPEICAQETEKNVEDCPKPHEYITINDFTMNCLPEQLRDEDTFQLVNILSNLTVKITSPKKMEHTTSELIKQKIKKIMSSLKNIFRVLNNTLYQENNQCLKLEETEASNSQGLEASRNQYGSGRIAGIQKATERDAITCRCIKCKNNKIDSTDLWIVLVFTATHVVPDTASAKKTTCTLSYDTEGTNEAMLEKIYGTHVHWNHKRGDLCLLYCVTCNSDLVNKLQKDFKEFNTAWKKLRNRADNLDCTKLLLTHCPIVIVSHPHGKNKKISFGQIEKLHPAPKPGTKELQLKREYQLKYKACTCPGSSGAPVYVLGINYFKIEFVHSGARELENFNYSTKWYLENRDLVEN